MVLAVIICDVVGILQLAGDPLVLVEVKRRKK
jgi:hypothetical protein